MTPSTNKIAYLVVSNKQVSLISSLEELKNFEFSSLDILNESIVYEIEIKRKISSKPKICLNLE